MDLDDLIRICKKYNSLGWSVQEQLHEVVESGVGGQNPNALKMIVEFLEFAGRHGADSEVDDLADDIEMELANR